MRRQMCAAAMGSARRRSTSEKSTFSGPEASETGRLRPLQEENVQLKKLLAEAMLDRVVLKDLAAKDDDDPVRGGKR